VADVTNTGNGEPGTGVWELMYSGNPLENSKWRSKQKKGSKRNNLGKGEFPPAVPPDGQYVIVGAGSDWRRDGQGMWWRLSRKSSRMSMSLMPS